MKKIILFLFAFACSINFINAQWQQTNGPSGEGVQCLAISGIDIFAGTSSAGVWKRPWSQITGVEEISGNKAYSLYPNPANGKFTLSTCNSRLSINTISVFNMLGEEVYNFVVGTGIKQQEITIDLTQQPKGIYAVRLKAGEKFYCREIVVE